MCRYQFVVPIKREYWVHWEVLSSLTEGRVRIDPDRIRCGKKANEPSQSLAYASLKGIENQAAEPSAQLPAHDRLAWAARAVSNLQGLSLAH